MRRYLVMAVGAMVLGTACEEDIVAPGIEQPLNLTYSIEPSGDPDAPAGVLLRWDPVLASDLLVYRVYSRPGTSGSFDLRGETTSTTFHDTGIPDLDYAVSAVRVDGVESVLTQVRIDERLRLQRPNFLVSTSLNGAIALAWDDNPFQSAPSGFKQYRVYSATYSLDDNLCGAQWSLEGTTVSPEFIAGALPNGVPRCFGVSAESVEGFESLWSDIRADTPRPDARNVVIYADAVDPTRAGFRFYQDLNGNGQVDPSELGIVGSSASTTIDFWIFRDASTQRLFFVPERTGTTVALYGSAPVADLTSIDLAPLSGYSRTSIEALPGWGYVFEMDGGDGFARYGAVRPTHVGRDFLIVDWSYQTDPGNPELQVRGGLPTAGEQELVVRRR
ncbi:MAG: hypothetical protein OER21_13405 [Gemmatimonadota bacterium]|nr:hypothetical protein [Gemmatimonadota bacterium]